MSAISHTEQPATTPLKILWVNPINQSGYDQPIADLIERVKLPNTEVHVVSLDIPEPVKLTNLEWRGFESKIWFPVTAIANYAAENGYDGYAIGCFYDTALDEAREVSGDAVVCAPCQSALQIVSNLCNRFSVVIDREGCDRSRGRIACGRGFRERRRSRRAGNGRGSCRCCRPRRAARRLVDAVAGKSP